MEEAILAQMYADRRNIWLSQLNPIQEQLLSRLPGQVMDFDIPENLKYVAKESATYQEGATIWSATLSIPGAEPLPPTIVPQSAS